MSQEEYCLPEARSFASIHAHYCREYPLYGAYWSVVEEHGNPDAPITVDRGGISTIEAARIALERIGRPARDDDDCHWAHAFVARLGDEVAALAEPSTPTITTALLDHFLPLWGRIPTLEEWAAEPEMEKDDTSAEITKRLPPELVARIVKDAMPGLLADVIAEDKRLRLERRYAAEIEAERLLHAAGQFHESKFPRGAFPGLPVDQGGDGELAERAVGLEGRADADH